MEQHPDHHLEDHPDGKEQHDGAVPGVPEHDGEEKGEGGNRVSRRVYLSFKIKSFLYYCSLILCKENSC